MDKASASGAGDSRFESWAGHIVHCHFARARASNPYQQFAFGSIAIDVIILANVAQMKPPAGIEPATVRLRSACSAN